MEPNKMHICHCFYLIKKKKLLQKSKKLFVTLIMKMLLKCVRNNLNDLEVMISI